MSAFDSDNAVAQDRHGIHLSIAIAILAIVNLIFLVIRLLIRRPVHTHFSWDDVLLTFATVREKKKKNQCVVC